MPKNWCFLTAVLEKTLESPLDYKETQPVHSKGDQSWVFYGRNDAKAETTVIWPPHAKSWLIGKYSDAGRDWGQEEKGMTEDEMVGCHHRLDGCEFAWTLGVGDGQGGLACCNSWGHKESDTIEWLNWTELKLVTFTLAISFLTTSSLPWFMDITFQVPMKYCSLQHQILLPSPVTSTTGCYFCFGSVFSFFLESFLHWSPIAIWEPTDLGSSSFLPLTVFLVYWCGANSFKLHSCIHLLLKCLMDSSIFLVQIGWWQV